jgi:membrane protease YdiL (CAAX protease family)
MLTLIRRYPVATFFVLAFGLTWVVWIPRAVASQGLLTADLPNVLGQVWTWMPALAALLAAALTGGRAAVKDLGVRLVRWRVRWQWYFVILLGPAAFTFAVAGVYVLLGGSWTAAWPWRVGGGLLAIVPLFLVLVLTDGLGEELGWRGFALPRLLVRDNAMAASLILGTLWAVWHLPLIWTVGAPLYLQPVWLLLLDTTAKSVIFTWVFLHTRGSVFLAVLLHASTNLFVVSPVVAGNGDLTLLVLAAAAKWLLVVAVTAAAGPRLTRGPRTEALPMDRARTT